MYAKLDEILARYRDIERQLADPAAAPDGARLARLAKEHGSLAKVAKPYQEFLKLQQEIATAEDLLRQADNDPDMRGYAQEELGKLKQREQELITRLEDLLLLDPEEDYDSVIMEIRAGTGGEEAALFARDLYEMYTRYARDQGWTVEELDCHPTDLGGFKEVSFSVSGEGVYRHLRYESGGHRVQRVPKTETQGRIHTSAATVAVLPEPTEIQVEIRPEDVRVDTFCSGGPGGQHQNKTQSGVRLTHLPTGTVAECRSERSQHKNKAQAWRMLRSRLYEALLSRQQAQRAAERRCQIGSGDRSERIRTYNFPQNRVTDHRINLNLYQLDSILMGDLGGLIRHLMEYDKRQRLGQLSRPEKQLA